MVENQSFTGTTRYASIRSQQRQTVSRRDDIESIGYMLIYFLRGELPWQKVRRDIPAKQRKEEILKIKENTEISDLCSGLDVEFEMFLRHCRSIGFDKMPIYAYYRHLLR